MSDSGSYTLGYEWQRICDPGDACRVYASLTEGVLVIDGLFLDQDALDKAIFVEHGESPMFMGYAGLFARALDNTVVTHIHTMIPPSA